MKSGTVKEIISTEGKENKRGKRTYGGDGGADEPHDPEERVSTEFVTETWMTCTRAITDVIIATPVSRCRIACCGSAVGRALADDFVNATIKNNVLDFHA